MSLTDQGEQGNSSESTGGQSRQSRPARTEGYATDTGSTGVKDSSPSGDFPLVCNFHDDLFGDLSKEGREKKAAEHGNSSESTSRPAPTEGHATDTGSTGVKDSSPSGDFPLVCNFHDDLFGDLSKEGREKKTGEHGNSSDSTSRPARTEGHASTGVKDSSDSGDSPGDRRKKTVHVHVNMNRHVSKSSGMSEVERREAMGQHVVVHEHMTYSRRSFSYEYDYFGDRREKRFHVHVIMNDFWSKRFGWSEVERREAMGQHVEVHEYEVLTFAKEARDVIRMNERHETAWEKARNRNKAVGAASGEGEKEGTSNGRGKDKGNGKDKGKEKTSFSLPWRSRRKSSNGL